MYMSVSPMRMVSPDCCDTCGWLTGERHPDGTIVIVHLCDGTYACAKHCLVLNP